MPKINYPKNEHVWVGHYNFSGDLISIITTKNCNRDWYYLYEFVDGEFKKVGKEKSPEILEQKFRVAERQFSD